MSEVTTMRHTLDRLAQGKQGKRNGIHHHDELKENDGFAFIHMLNEHTSRQREEEGRQGGGKTDQPEVEGTSADAICQQWECRILHGGADQGK